MKRFALAALLLAAAACQRGMYHRPARRPLGATPFFTDRTASRPLVADTVPRAEAPDTTPVTVARGRERFTIYCQPCHGPRGDGDGVIVRHGFPRPPAFSSQPLSAAQVVAVITNGTGDMYSYADRVPERDREAIAAYVMELRSGRAP